MDEAYNSLYDFCNLKRNGKQDHRCVPPSLRPEITLFSYSTVLPTKASTKFIFCLQKICQNSLARKCITGFMLSQSFKTPHAALILFVCSVIISVYVKWLILEYMSVYVRTLFRSACHMICVNRSKNNKNKEYIYIYINTVA